MYLKFKNTNLWPSRQQVNNFMPKALKDSYPTTRCIVDAAEIFIQTPSKNHNMLVVLTPQVQSLSCQPRIEETSQTKS